MSNIPREIYEFGLDYHPNEVALPLTTDDLNTLNAALIEIGGKPQEKTLLVAPAANRPIAHLDAAL